MPSDDLPGYYIGRPVQPKPEPPPQIPGDYFVGRPEALQEAPLYVDINLELSPGILEAQAERIISTVSGMRGTPILPIIGLGGIGKTKLARMVFHHTEFQDYYKAWVDVPETFDLLDIGKSIIFELARKDCHASNDKVQIKELLGNLVADGEKKLLIVLDGLREEDDSILEELKRMLDVGENVVVMVTTRSVSIARKICTMEPHKLDADMCWQITKIPEATRADLITRSVLRSLKQSYNRMEPDLKSCFEYCAIFPDGHSIIKDDLIHQWIALELIKPDEESTSQQVGEKKIWRLLDISFLQPAKSTLDSEKCTLLTMNDVVRALARSVVADKVLVLDGKTGANTQKNNCPYALVSSVDFISSKLSRTLSDKLQALHFQGCGGKELSDDSLSFAKNLWVLQLSGLSNRRLPDSISRLKQLKHLNLSRCDVLEQLPKSFGELTNVAHINLSRCYGLLKLPESFGHLKNLVHLDLSFCSCFQGISTILSGLTKLEHLNLSHPCCCPSEDNRSHLTKLTDVWEKLTKLRYLNLSMFLNTIFRHMPEEEKKAYLGNLSCLTTLEHLDLSHNIFLFHLPESLGKLTNLLTLDLSGCIRLRSVDQWVSGVKSLKVVEVRNCRALGTYEFVVHADDGVNRSSLVRLEDVSSRVLEISCLENVKSVEEAKRIRLVDKRNLMKLALRWTFTADCLGYEQDEALLAELVPPKDLQFFMLQGYLGASFPVWLTTGICSHLPNLVEVTMVAIPRWCSLQPFGLLPNLERLTLKKMASITRIDLGDQNGGSGAAFRRLSELTLDDLENLEKFMAAQSSDGQRTMYALVIQKCPKLRFEPCPPRAKMLLISDCRQLISSLANRAPGRVCVGEGPSTSSTASASGTELVIEVPMDELNWKKLKKLPSPDCLHIKNCDNRTISQDILTDIKKVIGPIKSLRISQCDRMTSLPEYLNDLASLSELVIHECPGIKSLPQSIIQNLNKPRSLLIGGCPELKSWCEAEENQKKLSRINIIYEQ